MAQKVSQVAPSPPTPEFTVLCSENYCEFGVSYTQLTVAKSWRMLTDRTSPGDFADHQVSVL